jgi:murein L,D-transpeptidase YafK
LALEPLLLFWCCLWFCRGRFSFSSLAFSVDALVAPALAFDQGEKHVTKRLQLSAGCEQSARARVTASARRRRRKFCQSTQAHHQLAAGDEDCETKTQQLAAGDEKNTNERQQQQIPTANNYPSPSARARVTASARRRRRQWFQSTQAHPQLAAGDEDCETKNQQLAAGDEEKHQRTTAAADHTANNYPSPYQKG